MKLSEDPRFIGIYQVKGNPMAKKKIITDTLSPELKSPPKTPPQNLTRGLSLPILGASYSKIQNFSP